MTQRSPDFLSLPLEEDIGDVAAPSEELPADPSAHGPTHPALPQRRQPWGLLLGGSLVLVGATWALLQWMRPHPQPQEAVLPAIAVETLAVTPQSAPSALELSGTIRPIDQALLSTRVTGRITQLSLEEGDRVTQGQVVARIDVTDMAAQANQARSGVVQAESGVAQAQSGLMQARSELSRAQALLSQLASQRIEVQAALQLAQIDQRRMDQLQSAGAIARDRLDQANTTLAQAKAKVAQVDAGMRQAQAAVTQSQAAIAQSQATVERAEAAAAQAEFGVTAATAGVSYGKVVAPFDGVVVQKLAYAGELAAPGTPLLKLESQDRLQLEIAVPEDNLRLVRRGQSVQVRVDAANQTYRAAVSQIVPSADANSRSFLVKIPLPSSEQLIAGMFGRLLLPQTAQPRMTIPTAALIRRGQLQGVFVVQLRTQQPTAMLRWVKTGKVHHDRVDVEAGLMAGDRLITSNLAQLVDGQPVTLRP